MVYDFGIPYPPATAILVPFHAIAAQVVVQPHPLGGDAFPYSRMVKRVAFFVVQRFHPMQKGGPFGSPCALVLQFDHITVKGAWE